MGPHVLQRTYVYNVDSLLYFCHNYRELPPIITVSSAAACVSLRLRCILCSTPPCSTPSSSAQPRYTAMHRAISLGALEDASDFPKKMSGVIRRVSLEGFVLGGAGENSR